MPHGATPRMYISFLAIWRKLFEQQRAKVAERVEHLRGGLDKLNEATAEVDTNRSNPNPDPRSNPNPNTNPNPNPNPHQVDKLSRSANEQRALLTQKQQEADVAMEQIQKSMERAVERKGEVEMLQKKLGKEEVQMQERKGGVEEELSKIAPVLEAAKAAVGGIPNRTTPTHPQPDPYPYPYP